MKQVVWLGTSKRDVSAFPADAKQDIGLQLFRVQQGLEPTDWKPMLTAGAGVNEIRVQFAGQWRVLYVAKFANAVYVLHVFGKKTQRTPKADIDIAAKRYRELLAMIGKGNR